MSVTSLYKVQITFTVHKHTVWLQNGNYYYSRHRGPNKNEHVLADLNSYDWKERGKERIETFSIVFLVDFHYVCAAVAKSVSIFHSRLTPMFTCKQATGIVHIRWYVNLFLPLLWDEQDFLRTAEVLSAPLSTCRVSSSSPGRPWNCFCSFEFMRRWCFSFDVFVTKLSYKKPDPAAVLLRFFSAQIVTSFISTCWLSTCSS